MFTPLDDPPEPTAYESMRGKIVDIVDRTTLLAMGAAREFELHEIRQRQESRKKDGTEEGVEWNLDAYRGGDLVGELNAIDAQLAYIPRSTRPDLRALFGKRKN